MIKPIERDKVFEKHFRKRITSNKKLLRQFAERYDMFYLGKRGYPLNDHALVGARKGMRSFSITADIRVIYREESDCLIFLDIGTHAQL